MHKIAFFDIDGTLTSDIDGTIPASVAPSIRQAQKNGHFMFINTGRCFSNLPKEILDIGFDGYICGCGTDIFYNGKELLHISQDHKMVLELLKQARKTNVDILFEARDELFFDNTRPLTHPRAIRHRQRLNEDGYKMRTDLNSADCICDKFVVWYSSPDKINEFRKLSDKYFECIDRGGMFCEFVPSGYSKATGIQYLLDNLNINLNDSYAFGDSNNDLAMFDFVPNSIAMGNTLPEELKDRVSYITARSSEDGIQKALKHFGFLDN